MPTPRQEAPPAEPWREVVALADAAQAPAKAEPEAPYVKLPAEVRGTPGGWIAVVPESSSGGQIKWRLGPGLTRVEIEKLFPGQKSAGIVFHGPEGEYEILAWTAKGDLASDLMSCRVIIGKPVPVPPGPVPPGPGPTPPGPAPAPSASLRVLIIYESGEVSKLPAAQQQVLYSKKVRDYLDSKTVVGPDGKTHDWRIYDKDVDASADGKHWQEALSRPRQSLPWIVIQGPKPYEGPLPATVEATLELLQKHGG